jgi:hypothetical protein
VPVAVSGAPVQKGFSAMNFRILAGSVRPRGQAMALLAASALSATLIVSGAQAQAPAPAGPKSREAPPAGRRRRWPGRRRPRPPAGRAGGSRSASEQQVQLICTLDQDLPDRKPAPQVCLLARTRIESGQPVIAAVIIEPEGGQRPARDAASACSWFGTECRRRNARAVLCHLLRTAACPTTRPGRSPLKKGQNRCSGDQFQRCA